MTKAHNKTTKTN